MCQGIKNKPIEAIQPIVTKVKPSDLDFDINELQSTLNEQVQNEIQTQINSHPKLHLKSDDENVLKQKQQIMDEFEVLKQFYLDFAFKIVLYDPLDRQIPKGEDDDEDEEGQAIKCEEFLNII